MTTKGTILKTIREFCLSCCNGNSKEVELCEVGNNPSSTVGRCQLYPYRQGKDPKPGRKSNFPKNTLTQDRILTQTGGLSQLPYPAQEGRAEK